MVNRKPRPNALLTLNEVHRKPLGPASDPKSFYALLLRFVRCRRERNGSETTLKVQTHHIYRFICGLPSGVCTVQPRSPGRCWKAISTTCTTTAKVTVNP